MDVLSQLLELMHISGSVMAEIRCGGGWGIAMETGEGIPFHFILEGECWLLDGEARIPLSAGDLVVAAHWPDHALASTPDHPLETISQLLTANGLPIWTGGTLDRPLRFSAGSDHVDVRILSGVFTVQGRGAAMLIEQLPPLLYVNTQAEGLGPQLKTALDFIRQESGVTRPGYAAVADRLMDLLFLQILRAVITRPTINIGLLAGLADVQLARALAAVHAKPEAAWTVALLASEASLSRAVFAERFHRVVGVTPIHYVNRWRMTVAEDLLAQPGMTIDAIRTQLGFSSGVVFARAFRQHRGLSPRDYRRSILKHDAKNRQL